MRAPGVDHVQSRAVANQEDDARQHIGGCGQQLQFGLRHDSERAFAASEQIDPIHPGRERISGRVLGGVGQRELGHVEIDFVAAAHIKHAAIHQRHSQPENVAPRAAIAEAARSAGVGGDGSADAGGALGGIGRVELAGARGRRLQRFERDAGAGDSAARADFEPLEFFERDRPAAMRHAAAGESRARAHDRDGMRRPAKLRR